MEFVHVPPLVDMEIVEYTLLLAFFVVLMERNRDGCGVDYGEGILSKDVPFLLARI